MNMHYGSDVSRLQFFAAVAKNYVGKHYLFVFTEHYSHLLLGKAVMSLGESFPGSTCQTVATRGFRPSGVSIGPSM